MGDSRLLRQLKCFSLVLFLLMTQSHPDRGRATPETENWWQPAVGTSWQWQLSGDSDRSVEVDVIDLDLFETSAEKVAELHANGLHVICYVSVGTVEEWRPDANAFPEPVVGDSYDEWPGERWLDIRQIDSLAPVLSARLDLCAKKGFDGVEPDNVDGFSNETGFAISATDQIHFLRWIAAEAHARGLSAGLKNAPELVDVVITAFDWALVEDCYVEHWCDQFRPFVETGKPVYMAEYRDALSVHQFDARVCPFASSAGYSAILKDRDLDASRHACPDH